MKARLRGTSALYMLHHGSPAPARRDGHNAHAACFQLLICCHELNCSVHEGLGYTVCGGQAARRLWWEAGHWACQVEWDCAGQGVPVLLACDCCTVVITQAEQPSHACTLSAHYSTGAGGKRSVQPEYEGAVPVTAMLQQLEAGHACCRKPLPTHWLTVIKLRLHV